MSSHLPFSKIYCFYSYDFIDFSLFSERNTTGAVSPLHAIIKPFVQLLLESFRGNRDAHGSACVTHNSTNSFGECNVIRGSIIKLEFTVHWN